MSAPSSVCSDDSFEIVNNETDIEDSKDSSPYKPKVSFHEVFDVYPMDADILARVTFDDDYVRSDQDTVVVLPIAWKSVDQALCAANINGSYVRFDVKDLPKSGAEDKFYQLCYCTAEKIVMGISIPFSFRDVHEDELIEFQKEQNKEFWTFRSRFAVLKDYYWNALKDIQAGSVKVDSKETSDDDTSKSDATNVNESGENSDNVDKPAENTVSGNKILLFQLIKDENEKIRQEKQKLKSLAIEIARAMAVDDRETCHRLLNNAINNSGEVFTEDEFFELRELLKQGFTVPTTDANSSENVAGAEESQDDINDSENLAKLDESHENVHDSFKGAQTIGYSNDKILLFKIMEDENATLKKQYEEENRLRLEAQNKINQIKRIFWQMIRTLDRNNDQKLTMELEAMLAAMTSVFDSDEMFRFGANSRIGSLKYIAEKKMKELEVAFVATSDGNIVLANQCDKQVSTETVETPKTTSHESVKKWEAKIAVLSEERDKLLAEVNEQQAAIKNLNEQLINQRQSEVEKMITVTNNMRDQFLKNMNQLTDSNKVLEEQLKNKDEEIKTLNANLLDVSKLLTENEREIRDLKARDHSFVGFLERRNLKRIAELGEKLQVNQPLREQIEMYSKIWAERQESAKLKDDLLTTQTLLNSLCDELEKTSGKKSMENSAQTGDDVYSVRCTSASPPESPIPEVPTTSAGFRRIKQREQALATKLVEMASNLENMKAIHDKTKTDLESRLKDGAKQYAKLYMKYEKLTKRSQTQSREPSN